MVVVSYVLGRVCGLVGQMINGDDESIMHARIKYLKTEFFFPLYVSNIGSESNMTDEVHELNYRRSVEMCFGFCEANHRS